MAGVMLNRSKKTWVRLDNASKIFPATCNSRDTKVFRLTCELTDEVMPELLQEALDQTLKSFPHCRAVMRRGIFWYYIESSDLPIQVEADVLPVCAPLYRPEHRNPLLRVTHYRRRIHLEMFHALADGVGAKLFMELLVYYYLLLRYPAYQKLSIPVPITGSIAEKMSDSYRYFFQARPVEPAPFQKNEPAVETAPSGGAEPEDERLGTRYKGPGGFKRPLESADLTGNRKGGASGLRAAISWVGGREETPSDLSDFPESVSDRAESPELPVCAAEPAETAETAEPAELPVCAAEPAETAETAASAETAESAASKPAEMTAVPNQTEVPENAESPAGAAGADAADTADTGEAPVSADQPTGNRLPPAGESAYAIRPPRAFIRAQRRKARQLQRRSRQPDVRRAYRIRGSRMENDQTAVVEGLVSVQDFKKQVQRYGVSMTVFLTALQIYAIGMDMPRGFSRYPITVSVPVDLRQRFPSHTSRNFFCTILISYMWQEVPVFENLVAAVQRQFEAELETEKLMAKLEYQMRIERNIAVRMVPLPIKDLVLRAAHRLNDLKVTTAMSNLGVVRFPEPLSGRIHQMGLLTSVRRPQFCVISCGDRMVITFTSPFSDTEIQRHFFSFLTKVGVPVTIAANINRRPDVQTLQLIDASIAMDLQPTEEN